MHFQLFKIFRRPFRLGRNIYQIAEALCHGRAPFIDCPNNNNDTTMQGMALKKERGRWESTMAAGAVEYIWRERTTWVFVVVAIISPPFIRPTRDFKSQMNFQFSNMMRSASGQSQVEANGDVVLVPWG